MANYPPPPPGGYGPPGGPPGWGPQGQPAYDPYAADRALAAWATERQYELVAQPDPNFYFSWYPFAYLPRPGGVTRELRATIDDARLFVGEGTEADPLRQAMGGSARLLFFFILSPRLRCRASVRSKQGGGIDKEIGRELYQRGRVPVPASARCRASRLGAPRRAQCRQRSCRCRGALGSAAHPAANALSTCRFWRRARPSRATTLRAQHGAVSA